MDKIEKLYEYKNTIEGQEKIKKWFEQHKIEWEAEDLKRQDMFSNANYIQWLINFTIKHPSFASDDWLYCTEQISKEDNKKVDDLYLLFEGINSYARKNYIYSTSCPFGEYYKIIVNDIGFEIGAQFGQGTNFFCNRVEIENDKEFIDFNDIINNKIPTRTVIIKNKLKELSDYIISLYNSGIPQEAITSTFDLAFKEINNIDKTNNKVLKKK